MRESLMRDLVFKNLTSDDKRRKIIASSEVLDKKGVRSIIHRHFICLVKEVGTKPIEKPSPYLYVLKEQNHKEQKQGFFCKIKGSVYTITNGKLYLILFMHTLKIKLISISEDLVKYNEG
jgi:hypothetical protein